MIRITRLRPAIAPTAVALVVGVGMAGLIAASFVVQRPYEVGADGAQQVLGWARAGLFTAGAVAFATGLAMALRGVRDELPPSVWTAPATPPRVLPASFTLVALGRSPEDTRAIADADTAAEAIRILREWSEDYPSERIVIFNADAEPIAVKRPQRARRRHAA
jgi:hypothetical protein